MERNRSSGSAKTPITRRSLIVGLLPATLLATVPTTSIYANKFADLYNEWAALQRQAGTIDAHEIRLWYQVREAWKVLDRTIRYDR